VEVITYQLVKIANTDNDKIEELKSYLRKRKLRSYWDRYKMSATVLITAFLFLFILYKNNNQPSSNSGNQSSSNNNPVNGDLNSSFNNDINTIPELTEEQKFQLEKEKLTAEGWKEPQIENGQLPVCYNFIPKKSRIDNYLEVYVGGGTDVAIKVMSIKNDNCVRFVFINSRSTYRIKNIPEGQYYLKIAYGKNWFSKIENGQCIGKFARNPIYEKGEEIMDFNLQEREDSYSIPSFKLSLDIIASDVSNTFASENISETEFNE
jgi:hypothetical protein